jgi:hypothetical protein
MAPPKSPSPDPHDADDQAISPKRTFVGKLLQFLPIIALLLIVLFSPVTPASAAPTAFKYTNHPHQPFFAKLIDVLRQSKIYASLPNKAAREKYLASLDPPEPIHPDSDSPSVNETLFFVRDHVQNMTQEQLEAHLADVTGEMFGRSAEARRLAIGTFFDRNQTFLKELDDENDELALNASQRFRKSTGEQEQTLASILGSRTASLGAIVNLGLGAVAIPEGLAIVSSSKIYVPLIEEVILPHWAIPLRSPTFNWKRACEGLGPECEQVLNPEVTDRQCPGAQEIVANYREIMTEFRAQYEGAANPRFYSQLMHKFCEREAHLCTVSKKGPAPKRKKRAVILAAAVLGVAGILGGITSLGMGIANHAAISRLESQMDSVIHEMNHRAEQMRLFKLGMIRLEESQIQMVKYMKQSIAEIYSTIEQVRCTQQIELLHLARDQAVKSFRLYIQGHLDAIMETATTGRLTPRVLGVQQLRQILKGNPATAGRLVEREPSLVYQFGRVFPVMVDFETASYGYILEIPNPEDRDIWPKYKIINAGFHPLPDDAAYYAPLPSYGVVSRSNDFLTLETDLCVDKPGLSYCETGAVTAHAVGSSCLQTLLGEGFSCPNCKEGKYCSHEISELTSEKGKTQVVTTLAGVMVRTPDKTITLFKENPILVHGTPGRALTSQ